LTFKKSKTLIMKLTNKYLLTLLLISGILLGSCKKYEEEKPDFSKSQPPYVTLKSTAAKTVKQGAALKFNVLVRTALQEDVTVSYDISGGFTKTGTFIVPRNTTDAPISIDIPAGTVPSGGVSLSGTFKILSATRPGGSLTVGRIDPAKEKFTVKVTE
jgi:hypothetical protein